MNDRKVYIFLFEQFDEILDILIPRISIYGIMYVYIQTYIYVCIYKYFMYIQRVPRTLE